MNKNIFERIHKWQEERGLLLDGYNSKTETLNLLEELIESKTNLTSKGARRGAKFLHFWISVFEFLWCSKVTKERSIDAYCDIIVFSTGALLKMGTNPEKAIHETLLEIESRTGKRIDGKFIKDPNAKRYVADYSGCDLSCTSEETKKGN